MVSIGVKGELRAGRHPDGAFGSGLERLAPTSEESFMLDELQAFVCALVKIIPVYDPWRHADVHLLATPISILWQHPQENQC